MGDVARRVFCGTPASEPSRRSAPVRATELPHAPPAPRSVAERIVDDGMARTRETSEALAALEALVRRTDTPGLKCASPWCPRRPGGGRDTCVVCTHAETPKARRQRETIELLGAGWTPTTRYARHWKDPVAPHAVLTRREALALVRRDVRKEAVRGR